jgi:hypothetical protein
MVQGKQSSLPIEAFVHVEDINVPQRNTTRVDELRKGLVPALGPAGDDRSRGQIAKVILFDHPDKFLRHKRAHRLRIGDLAIWNA